MERHDVRAGLKLCGVCLMREADQVDARESAKQSVFNLHQSILNICRKYKITQSTLAHLLGMSPIFLSEVKHGERPFPPQAFARIKEKYSECLASN
jgi:hypothetical protein